MFKKVLIAEDADSIGIGIHATLNTIGIIMVETTKYCDDALLKIKNSHYNKEPFDLLITDLSFKKDHRNVILKNGEELIAEAKIISPDLKVLAYSIEDKPYKIKQLFDKVKISGYICKGRESAREFGLALHNLYEGAQYISPQLQHCLHTKVTMEIDDNDVLLLECLRDGLLQEEISKRFQAEGRIGSSTSSLEKRINKLKIFLMAKTTPQLISIAKDMGVI